MLRPKSLGLCCERSGRQSLRQAAAHPASLQLMHPPSLRVLMLQRLLPALEARGIGAPNPCSAHPGLALTRVMPSPVPCTAHVLRTAMAVEGRKPPQRCAAGRQHHYRVSRCISRASLASTCIFLRPSKSVPDLVPQCFYPLSPSTPDPLDKPVEEDDLSIIPCLKVPFSFFPLPHHRLHIVIDTGSQPENPSFPISSAPLSCRYYIQDQGVFKIPGAASCHHLLSRGISFFDSSPAAAPIGLLPLKEAIVSLNTSPTT